MKATRNKPPKGVSVASVIQYIEKRHEQRIAHAEWRERHPRRAQVASSKVDDK